jgi:hypothetical protein
MQARISRSSPGRAPVTAQLHGRQIADEETSKTLRRATTEFLKSGTGARVEGLNPTQTRSSLRNGCFLSKR